MAGAAFAAELEREKARSARDAVAQGRKGYNTGGRVYGYDNVPVTAPLSTARKSAPTPTTAFTPRRPRSCAGSSAPAPTAAA